MNNINNRIKKATLLLLTLGAVIPSMAKDVKGKVTDAATGAPLVGVRIQAYGDKKHAAMTNAEGEYTISVPDYVQSLYMTLEGSAPLQVAIGDNKGYVNAQLYSSAFRTEYSASTNATHTSLETEFNNNAEVSIDPFIQQRLSADVRTVSRGATDGIGNVMFINGLNSLSINTQPLIVIDGVIMDMEYNCSMIHDGYYNNILANINVNDIDKVEVLKNGTALYGAKGANGVICITTKRNKSMATKIDLTIGGKFKMIPRTAKMLNADDYMTYATELLASEVGDISGMKFLNSDPAYYYYPQYHNDTDWKKQVYRNTFTQSYGINVQGGDEVANYNLSVGYSDANSLLKANDFSRFDMRLNTDIEVLRNLDVRFDAAFSDVKRGLRDIGVPEDIDETTILSPNFLALIKAPFLSPYAIDVYGNVSNYIADADDYLQDCIITNDRSLANPLSIQKNGDGENSNTFGNRLVTFSITPRYKFSNHLALSEAFNFTLVNTNEEYYTPILGVPRFRVPGLTERVYVDNIKSSLAARHTTIQSDTRLTWNNSYDAHNINVFGGVRYINSAYKLNTRGGYDTGNDKTRNLSSALKYKTTSGADDKYTDITWYANANYNYAEKYYLTATVAAQASSRFGKNADGLDLFGTKWGIFPSLQASYVITNEPWFPTKRGIDYLRFNLGYDVSGNDDIDFTASRSYFISTLMLGGEVTGKPLGNVGNDKLQWETTRRLTAGFEGNFINNHLHVAFNYFKSWTDNLLTLRQMAWTSGLNENWQNGGKLENHGFDVAVSYKLINTKDWHWQAGASVGHYKNKVTALDGKKYIDTDIYGATVRTSVDNPVGLFYGYTTDGVFATTEEAQASGLYQLDEANNKVFFQAGDMKFVDLDGNKVIDEKDRTVIGDPTPDIYGNITSSLNWKKWTLDVAFTYSLGNDIYNYQRSILESGKYFYNQTTVMNSRWTTEGQITDIPRISCQDPHGNARFSDRWIENGSYLRLSNVTLSYSLPIYNTFIQGITVWGSAQNIFTITRYLGDDPDCAVNNNVLSLGIDRGVLAAGRTFAMGVKINL